MSESIQPLGVEDLELCTELFIHVFHTEPWNEHWTKETAGKKLNDLFNTPGFTGYGMFDRGELIGFLAGYTEQRYDGKQFYLVEFCVKPERQRKGYGSKLLSYLERKLREQNVGHVYLLTMRDSFTEIFYKKKNYRVSGRIVLMAKNLNQL